MVRQTDSEVRVCKDWMEVILNGLCCSASGPRDQKRVWILSFAFQLVALLDQAYHRFRVHRSFPVLHWLRPSYTGNKIKNQSVICIEDVPLVEFMYLVFTRMPGESYLRRLRSFFVVVLVLRISSVN